MNVERSGTASVTTGTLPLTTWTPSYYLDSLLLPGLPLTTWTPSYYLDTLLRLPRSNFSRQSEDLSVRISEFSNKMKIVFCMKFHLFFEEPK
jgi:hypothetical protein